MNAKANRNGERCWIETPSRSGSDAASEAASEAVAEAVAATGRRSNSLDRLWTDTNRIESITQRGSSD